MCGRFVPDYVITPETLASIAARLNEHSVEESPVDSAHLLDEIHRVFAKVDNARFASRDEIPPVPELARISGAVADHLMSSVELISACNPWYLLWLRQFLKEREIDIDSALMGLTRLATTAEATAQYFDDLADKGEHTTIDYPDGTSIEHMRRTRTDLRDNMLIPELIRVFESNGLNLRDDFEGNWNADALDSACEIISLVLRDVGITSPRAGYINENEASQGRLRRLVKAAFHKKT